MTHTNTQSTQSQHLTDTRQKNSTKEPIRTRGQKRVFQTQKRIRLNNKQRWLLNNIFEAEQTLEEALDRLRIRPRTLKRWLTKPVFIEALETRITQFQLQARIETARSSPHAIKALWFLSKKSVKHESIRKASNDLLKLQQVLQSANPGIKAAQNGSFREKSGSQTDQLGSHMDKSGSPADHFGSRKIPPKPHYQLKIKGSSIYGTKKGKNSTVCEPRTFQKENSGFSENK